MKNMKDMKDLKSLAIKYPNDREFGTKARSITSKSEEFTEFLKKYPNDGDLGKKLRKHLNN